MKTIRDIATTGVFASVMVFLGAGCETENPVEIKRTQLKYIKMYSMTGAQTAIAIRQTNDGGNIVLADSDADGIPGGSEILLLKTDRVGEKVWEKRLTATGSAKGVSVTQAGDGGYLVFGERYPSPDGPLMTLLKTDAEGNRLWENSIGGLRYSQAMSMVVTDDGGALLLGRTYATVTFYMLLVRIGSDGQVIWERTTDFATRNLVPRGIYRNTGGGYSIITDRMDSLSVWEGVLVKVDESGNKVSETPFAINSEIVTASSTTDGGFIVTTNGGTPALPKIALTRLNVAGTILWNRSYPDLSSFAEQGVSLIQSRDGGFAVAATRTLAEGNALLILKTDHNGTTEWFRKFNPAYAAVAGNIIESSDGGYILAGSSQFSASFLADLLLIKTDSNGDSQ